MTERVNQLLTLFDSLPETDKHSAIEAILRRNPIAEADLSSSAFDELADELFTILDQEEDNRGDDA